MVIIDWFGCRSFDFECFLFVLQPKTENAEVVEVAPVAVEAAAEEAAPAEAAPATVILHCHALIALFVATFTFFFSVIIRRRWRLKNRL